MNMFYYSFGPQHTESDLTVTHMQCGRVSGVRQRVFEHEYLCEQSRPMERDGWKEGREKI